MPTSDHLRLVFCDSGLGGLDIAADLVAALRRGSPFRQVELVCFNAWLSPGLAFNQLPDFPAKFCALHRVMQGICRLEPDAVIFACNTLSVIRARDPEFPSYPFPIIDMIEPATELFARKLLAETDSQLILLGTSTTVDSRVYQEKLRQRGVAPKRVISCPCPGLATQIEYHPNGAEVALMLRKYARSCRAKIGSPRRLYLGLGCSHFGYISDLWREVFGALGAEIELLNPNREVLKAELPSWCSSGAEVPKLHIRILTKVPIAPAKRENIGSRIAGRAPELAAALQTPERRLDLF